MNKNTEILEKVFQHRLTYDQLVVESKVKAEANICLHSFLEAYNPDELKWAARDYYTFIWKDIVNVFNETRDEGPIVTVDKVVEKYGLDNTINTFVIVSGIKKSDGRIYGENRKFMDSVLSSPMFWEWKTDYHMRDCGLDDIHTAHINQMITELRKRSEK